MARFRGTVQGSRGEASRRGHKQLTLRASGWNGHIRVWLGISQSGEDWCTVHHETNDGHRLLYAGRLDHRDDPRGTKIPLYDTVIDPSKHRR